MESQPSPPQPDRLTPEPLSPQTRSLLQAFDGIESPGSPDRRRALTLDILIQKLVADPHTVLSVVEHLVERGWLERVPGAIDAYVRTEDGRLAIARPTDVTLYTRAGCHLCDQAKSQIAPLLQRAGAKLQEVDIDADPGLRLRYDVDVPVLFLGARKVAKHRVDLAQFERQLEAARRLADEVS